MQCSFGKAAKAAGRLSPAAPPSLFEV